jgi:hypothetical protein
MSLPCCPICTNISGPITHPAWAHAKLSSERQKKPVVILGGCQHARAFGQWRFLSDPAEIAKMEEGWCAEADRLFAKRTAHWTEIERSRFAAALGRIEKAADLPLEPDFSTPLPQPIGTMAEAFVNAFTKS